MGGRSVWMRGQHDANLRQHDLPQWERDRLTSDQRRELARRGSRVGVTKPTLAARKAKRRRKGKSS